MRVGSVKAAKKHSYGSPGKKKKKIGHDCDDDAVVDSVEWRHKQDPKNTDRHGSCKKCALKKMGKTNRKAHAKWCPESQDYKKKAAALLVSKISSTGSDNNNGGGGGISSKNNNSNTTTISKLTCKLIINNEINTDEQRKNWQQNIIMQTSQRSSSSTIRTPRSSSSSSSNNNNSTTTTTTMAEVSPIESNFNSDNVDVISHETLSAERIVDEIKKRIGVDDNKQTRSQRRSTKIPEEVIALFDYLIPLLPNRYHSGTNTIMIREGISSPTKIKLDYYRKLFPPGTFGFIVPPSDKSKPPDPHYQVIEGRKIYIMRMEMNDPVHDDLKCFECDTGIMIHDAYDFRLSGFLTAIIDFDRTDYAASMVYQCNNPNCNKRCKANDGRMLYQLPPHYRSGYPVDPKYAVNKQLHLSKTTTRLIEKLMITHGNGDRIAQIIHELRGQRYEDFEEEYYNQAIFTDTRVQSALSTEDQWRGKYGPTGTQIRDLFIEGKDSTLNSINISDRMRHIREIQSVGSKISTASDDTFAVLKNYISSQIPGAKAVHTINVETGELASAAIVSSTECTQWSHQTEQFSKRTNVNPKMHVTDNYPANSELFLAIFGNIILRLGLFHFVQRITRTLKKEHIDFPLAVGWLSSCLYYCDRGER